MQGTDQFSINAVTRFINHGYCISNGYPGLTGITHGLKKPVILPVPAGTAEDDDMGMKKKLALIVEDDKVFGMMLIQNLQREGYSCELFKDPRSVLEALDAGIMPDIFILDLNLGDELNGLDLCRIVKARFNRPVLMLTGNESEEVLVSCLDAGADQYLVKPYKNQELLARMRAALRYYQNVEELAGSSDSVSFRLERNLRILTNDKVQVPLTEREVQLLEILLGNIGTEMSREVLHRAIYGVKPGLYNRNVDVLVGRVRKKIKLAGSPFTIEQVRSHGYVMHTTGFNSNEKLS
jgi:DNA-binding response OmpR family regulator